MLLVLVVVVVDCRSITCASSFDGDVGGLKEQDVVLPPNRRSELKRKLVAVQVRAAALSRQLKKALEWKSVEKNSPDFESLNNEWGECYELISLLHADVLVSGADTDKLEKLACRVEDILFDLKKDICMPNERTFSDRKECGDELRIPVDDPDRLSPKDNDGMVRHEEDGPPPLLEMESFNPGPGFVPQESKLGMGLDRNTVGSRGSLNPNVARFVPEQFGSQHTGLNALRPAFPPAPRLTLESFNGEVIKYWDFKRRFKRHVEEVYPSFEDRMAFLESSCVGKAREVITGIGCLLNSRTAYVKAWERLDKRFGDVKKLMAHLRGELLMGSAIKEGDAEGLMKLSDKMYQCEVTFQGLGKMWMLDSQDLMHDLFERLPHRIKIQFVSVSTGEILGSFKDLRTLVEQAAAEAESEYGRLLYKPKPHPSGSRTAVSVGRNRRICVAQSGVDPAPPLQNCECCEGLHKLWKCSTFESKSVEDRRTLVKEKGLCFNCLLPGHRVVQCRLKMTCRKCGRRHNSLLHWESRSHEISNEQSSTSLRADERENPDASSRVCAATYENDWASAKSMGAIFKVVSVKVWSANSSNCVSTYAFIDEGSNINMCSSRLADRLGIPISATNVKLLTSNAESVLDRKIDSLMVQGINELERFKVKEAFVVDEVVDVQSSIPTNDLVQRFPHLSGLNFPSLDEGQIELLLGCDLHRAFLIKDVLVGNPGSTCGLHTALGWTIYSVAEGEQEGTESPELMVNFLGAQDNSDDSCDNLLKLLARDFEGCDDVAAAPVLSQDERRALGILNHTCKRVDGHISVGLLWRDGNQRLPNNRSVAEKRLGSLKRRFLNDPELFMKYSKKMEEYISNYAERIKQDGSSSNRINYLPHHCTAESTKFRVVFDCSTRCGGVSLNDVLLQGPNLTNTVVGVLLRFRQHPIAVVADIKGMFSQVLVEEENRDALRFLWFAESDLEKPVEEYRMRSHIFGAKSSPCCAAFALQRVAEDNHTGADEETIQTVVSDIYVDDLCKSCVSEGDAIHLIKQLCSLLEGGGFHLTKFLSNSKTVLDSVPPEDLAPEVKLNSGLPVHKALGCTGMLRRTNFGYGWALKGDPVLVVAFFQWSAKHMIR